MCSEIRSAFLRLFSSSFISSPSCAASSSNIFLNLQIARCTPASAPHSFTSSKPSPTLQPRCPDFISSVIFLFLAHFHHPSSVLVNIFPRPLAAAAPSSVLLAQFRNLQYYQLLQPVPKLHFTLRTNHRRAMSETLTDHVSGREDWLAVVLSLLGHFLEAGTRSCSVAVVARRIRRWTLDFEVLILCLRSLQGYGLQFSTSVCDVEVISLNERDDFLGRNHDLDPRIRLAADIQSESTIRHNPPQSESDPCPSATVSAEWFNCNVCLISRC